MKLLIILLIALLVSPVTALFGLGRKKKREEEAKAKEAAAAAAAATAPTSTIDPIDAVNVGMDNLMKTMADPDTLKQTMEMMQDPGMLNFYNFKVEKLATSYCMLMERRRFHELGVRFADIAVLAQFMMQYGYMSTTKCISFLETIYARLHALCLLCFDCTNLD